MYIIFIKLKKFCFKYGRLLVTTVLIELNNFPMTPHVRWMVSLSKSP